ncbi:Hypothetical predicted protein, partial [Pelobates cultripes]
DIGDITWSDHAAVWLTVKDNFAFRGTTPWRLNDTLLQNPEFSHKLNSEIISYFAQNNTPDISPATVWQAHKAVIRGHLISRASYLKRKSNQDYVHLLRSLRDETRAQISQPSPDRQQHIQRIQKQINETHILKTMNIMLRLKLNSYTQGNKARKALASTLRQKQQNAKIPFLFNEQGNKMY